MKKYTFLLFVIAVVAGCNQDPGDVVVTEPSEGLYEWLESSPQEQGFNAQLLKNAKIEAAHHEFILSLLVARHGSLVLELYQGDFSGQFTPFDIRSVTKSFVSALVGIALREGMLTSLDQRAFDFLQDYITPGMDRRKFDITIRHLLTMSAGFDHETSPTGQIPDNTDSWVQSTLELPLVFDPGAEFRYNSLETHLLSVILTKASEMTAREFANRYLFEPLEIRVRGWNRGPEGYYSGGAGMFFTARELARFGLFYLNNGVANGEQVLPVSWIEQSVSNQVGGNGSYGEIDNFGYGFQWWVGTIGGYTAYMAIGYGGQFIMNLPKLDMVIVTTAETPPNLGQADQQTIAITELIENHILTAVTE